MPSANILGAAAPVMSNGNNTFPVAWVARMSSSTPGVVSGMRYYVAQAGLGDGRVTEARMRLFDSSGGVDNLARELANKVITFAPTVGWQEWSFDTPIAIDPAHVYGGSIDFVSGTGNVLYGYTAGFTVPLTNDGLTLEMVGFRDAGSHAGYPGGSSGTVNFFVDFIVDAPEPVTVDVGTDRSVTAGTTVDVDAVASGSGTLTYAWSKISGPFGSFGDPTAASTTFSPNGGDGDYVLRCTVTDQYGSDFDEFTLTVIDPVFHAVPVGTILGTGWTYTGGADQTVLGDTSPTTYATSINNPVAQPLVLDMGDLDAPGPTVPLRLRLNADVVSGAGTITAKLYEGATLRSTLAPVALDVGSGGSVTSVLELSFPAADLTAISDWHDLRVRLEVTAA